MNNEHTIQFGRDQERLDTIKGYIRGNINADLHTAAIAKKFKISPSSLEHLFRQYEHKSYRQYLEGVRLIKAFQFLQTQRVTVKEAMYASGYKNRTTFNNAFKKVFGYPPGHFRK